MSHFIFLQVAGTMALLTQISILLVLACFSHQLMLSTCQKNQGRRGGKGVVRGQEKNRGLKVGRHPKSVSPQPVKGKTVTKDEYECSWAAAGDDVVTLRVNCTKAKKSFSCVYIARPAACPRYASNVKLYWKQVARAMSKQRELCRNSSALVRAGMCRGAARHAHFRLHETQRTTDPTSSPPPAGRAVKSCQPVHKKAAEEYCNDSWSSFCVFFFTMVQDDNC